MSGAANSPALRRQGKVQESTARPEGESGSGTNEVAGREKWNQGSSPFESKGVRTSRKGRSLGEG